MGALTSESTAWPDGVIQLLDEHHLVVIAHAQSSDHFAAALKHHLAAMAETQVISIDGREANTLRTFYAQVRKQLPVKPPPPHERANKPLYEVMTTEQQPLIERSIHDGAFELPELWWHDIESVIGLLRSADSSAKHRYFIWEHADVMLKSDRMLFSRLVNALLGVAAEQEYVSTETLVLQRCVFIGGPALEMYANSDDGQFQRWLTDDDDTPFWEVVSVLERPPVLTYRLS